MLIVVFLRYIFFNLMITSPFFLSMHAKKHLFLCILKSVVDSAEMDKFTVTININFLNIE